MDAKTDNSAIEAAFDRFTTERKDIAILLINQHIAERIRHRVEAYTAAFPSLLEIPSKDHPYDPEKDSVPEACEKVIWRVARNDIGIPTWTTASNCR